MERGREESVWGGGGRGREGEKVYVVVLLGARVVDITKPSSKQAFVAQSTDVELR
jgi:hypothetical protein